MSRTPSARRTFTSALILLVFLVAVFTNATETYDAHGQVESAFNAATEGMSAQENSKFEFFFPSLL